MYSKYYNYIPAYYKYTAAYYAYTKAYYFKTIRTGYFSNLYSYSYTKKSDGERYSVVVVNSGAYFNFPGLDISSNGYKHYRVWWVDQWGWITVQVIGGSKMGTYWSGDYWYSSTSGSGYLYYPIEVQVAAYYAYTAAVYSYTAAKYYYNTALVTPAYYKYTAPVYQYTPSIEYTSIYYYYNAV